MVNNPVFRWPKPLFFMVLGAHGSYSYEGIIISHHKDSYQTTRIPWKVRVFFCGSARFGEWEWGGGHVLK